MMVTTPDIEPTDPTPVERLEDAIKRIPDGASRAVRTTVTGDPTGRIRRKVLFVATLGGIVLNMPFIAAVALLLLAVTDDEWVQG